MSTKRKKKSFIPFVIFGIIVIIAGYYVAGACYPGANIFLWYVNFKDNVLTHLWANYYNDYTLIVIGIFLAIYAVFVLYYIVGQGNFMHGKEMGTAKFADPKDINKKFANKEDKDMNDPKNIVIYKKEYPFYMNLFINLKKKFVRR